MSRDTGKHTQTEMILDIIRKNPGLSDKELLSKMKSINSSISPATVNSACNYWKNKGFITRKKDGDKYIRNYYSNNQGTSTKVDPSIINPESKSINHNNEIIEIIKNNPGISKKEILDKTSSKTIDRVIKELKIDGQILDLKLKESHYFPYGKPEIISDSADPYVPDYIKWFGKEGMIPALTEKNKKFFEAVVRLDSNYRRDFNINAFPDSRFDPTKHVSNSDGLYCGSLAYWFNEMTINKKDYEKCLLGAIISIDRTNSTHLQATINGRSKIKETIMKTCPDVDALRTELKKDLSSNKKTHLIKKISDALPAAKEGETRSNISFASKFCSYASIHLIDDDKYSKYDNVVAKHLSKYVLLYLNEKMQKEKTDVVEMYVNYCSYIDRIRDSLVENENINLTRSELDHIIWYGFKG